MSRMCSSDSWIMRIDWCCELGTEAGNRGESRITMDDASARTLFVCLLAALARINLTQSLSLTRRWDSPGRIKISAARLSHIQLTGVVGDLLGQIATTASGRLPKG